MEYNVASGWGVAVMVSVAPGYCFTTRGWVRRVLEAVIHHTDVLDIDELALTDPS